jgi:hypothetical protein
MAAELFAKSTNLSIAGAWAELGELYEKGGGGIEKDEARAAERFAFSADHGNAKAQYQFGNMLCDGRGVAKDASKGKELMHQAAEAGFANAQYHMALLCAKSDPFKAIGLLNHAARQGHARAKMQIGRIQQGVPIEDEEIAPKTAAQRSLGRFQQGASKALFGAAKKGPSPFGGTASRASPPPDGATCSERSASPPPVAHAARPLAKLGEPSSPSLKGSPGYYSPLGVPGADPRTPLSPTASSWRKQAAKEPPMSPDTFLARALQPPSPKTVEKNARNKRISDFRIKVVKNRAAKLGLSLEELFVKVDLDGDGELTKGEVVAGHALLGMSPDEAAQLFDSLDSAKRGVLTRAQFGTEEDDASSPKGLPPPTPMPLAAVVERERGFSADGQ